MTNFLCLLSSPTILPCILLVLSMMYPLFYKAHSDLESDAKPVFYVHHQKQEQFSMVNDKVPANVLYILQHQE